MQFGFAAEAVVKGYSFCRGESKVSLGPLPPKSMLVVSYRFLNCLRREKFCFLVFNFIFSSSQNKTKIMAMHSSTYVVFDSITFAFEGWAGIESALSLGLLIYHMMHEAVRDEHHGHCLFHASHSHRNLTIDRGQCRYHAGLVGDGSFSVTWRTVCIIPLGRRASLIDRDLPHLR
jgi:hypothetical protein